MSDGQVSAKERARARALEHGWNWFRYHAEQRLSMIRFYLLLSSAIGAGALTLFQNQLFVPAAGVCLYGAFVTYCFYHLDLRVSRLIKLGEAVLDQEQGALRSELGYKDILIVQSADGTSLGWFGSYGKSLKLLFKSTIFMFFLGAIYSIFCGFPN